jgi:hypothetical protein
LNCKQFDDVKLLKIALTLEGGLNE